jgi:hypothetical protein
MDAPADAPAVKQVRGVLDNGRSEARVGAYGGHARDV